MAAKTSLQQRRPLHAVRPGPGRPAIEALVRYGGDVQELAEDLGIYRLALKGAIDEAASLFNAPDLPGYMERMLDAMIRFEERSSRLYHDTYDVTHATLRALRA